MKKTFIVKNAEHYRKAYTYGPIFGTVTVIPVLPFLVVKWLNEGEEIWQVTLFTLFLLWGWQVAIKRFIHNFTIPFKIEIIDDRITGIPHYTAKKRSVEMTFDEIIRVKGGKRGLHHIALYSSKEPKKKLIIPISIMGKPELFTIIRARAVNCEEFDLLDFPTKAYCWW